MAVIDRLPRSACVVAVRPAILSFVSDADFREFGKDHPQVYEALVALIAARLRGNDWWRLRVDDGTQLERQD
jgi:CRP-like cAMP-binding protein